jgi:hypothetical protein
MGKLDIMHGVCGA